MPPQPPIHMALYGTSASSRGSAKWPLIGSAFCYSIEGTVFFIFIFKGKHFFLGTLQ